MLLNLINHHHDFAFSIKFNQKYWYPKLILQVKLLKIHHFVLHLIDQQLKFQYHWVYLINLKANMSTIYYPNIISSYLKILPKANIIS